MLSGWDINAGDVFTIVTHSSRYGVFSANLPYIGDDKALEERYADTTTQLVVLDVPEVTGQVRANA